MPSRERHSGDETHMTEKVTFLEMMQLDAECTTIDTQHFSKYIRVELKDFRE